MNPSRRPEGQPTRGKTARNRLRRVDVFLSRYDPALLKQTDTNLQTALYIDLGYGDTPDTTMESAHRFWQINPGLHILGVEIDPERVSAAMPHQTDRIHFRLGGFNLPLEVNESVRLIRAFNVLRQYEEDTYSQSISRLMSSLNPGGLLVEGTSDPFGRVWVANLFRKAEDGRTIYEAVTFSTNIRFGFDPSSFQPVLPKNLIHHMAEPSAIQQFFDQWKAAALEMIHYKDFGHRQWFMESAYRLADHGCQLDLRKKMLKSGYLTWKNPPLR